MNLHIKNLVKKPYLLVFLNGFVIASLFYFQMERSYENKLYSAIKLSIDSKMDADDNQDSLLIRTMHTCNIMMKNRQTVFGGEDISSFKSDVLHPTTVDLMTAKGACGAYSIVLARMLQTAGYEVRIAQMEARGNSAAHMVVEAQTSKGWVVLDGLFDVYFIKPDHSLASFADVSRGWDNYYVKQVPANYDTLYRYAGVRYANWTKIPVVLPAIKGCMNFFMGKEKADTFCVRTHFLNTYTVYFYICILLYIPVFLLTFRRFLRSSVSFTASPERHIQFESQAQ